MTKHTSIIGLLNPRDQRRVAMGNAMKNPALTSAVLDGTTYERSDHRAFWAALRRKQGTAHPTIHLQF